MAIEGLQEAVDQSVLASEEEVESQVTLELEVEAEVGGEMACEVDEVR